MKLLVCGSRPPCACAGIAYCDVCKPALDQVWQVMQAHAPVPTEVVAGGARGPDDWAHNWAVLNGVPATVVKPDWNRYGRSAGMRRNEAMLDLKPDKVLAFWDGRSRGTKHMIEIARRAGVPVEIVVRPKP